MEMTLMFLTVVLVIGAILLARHLYVRHTEAATKVREKAGGAYTLLLNKYYVDEIYGFLVIKPFVGLSTFFWKIVDVLIIDGFVNGLARLGALASDLLRFIQTGRVRSYATIFAAGVVLVVGYLVLR